MFPIHWVFNNFATGVSCGFVNRKLAMVCESSWRSSAGSPTLFRASQHLQVSSCWRCRLRRYTPSVCFKAEALFGYNCDMYFAPPNMLVDLPVPVKAVPEDVVEVSVDRKLDYKALQLCHVQFYVIWILYSNLSTCVGNS
ncbi:hypothetical protein POM88_032958 [Heracleum sosnowskyi]|uniref:Uncharacterized protein n=1 Tax=Heracleum sosnowskyi TaxID=360622 RepID=A0AAD8I389_9APIA|nr:hypothetical protein POM88_032958 [Heracleum sosnowskyi]